MCLLFVYLDKTCFAKHLSTDSISKPKRETKPLLDIVASVLSEEFVNVALLNMLTAVFDKNSFASQKSHLEKQMQSTSLLPLETVVKCK